MRIKLAQNLRTNLEQYRSLGRKGNQELRLKFEGKTKKNK